MILSGAASPSTTKVNVIGAYVSREQAPVLLRAAFQKGREYHFPAVPAHGIRWLVHQALLCRNSLPVGCDQAASGQVMRAIDRAQLIAVQVATITGEGYQIGHNRFLRARLSKHSLIPVSRRRPC
jgi:hypothetical protein